ncbi:hypothetical protein PsYK624_109920 [Phanerochaete sordida]|uniref:DUF7729 domain-containing protein n=1 Tax=Phanerochaete sordida TaxID=48140 RepID=A0A9P3GH18_9APHY|nr:hypothetical protein PsYK624_109920 [Phanerochaete sordida]
MFTPPPSPAPPPQPLHDDSPVPSESEDSESGQFLVVPQAFPLRCTSAPSSEARNSTRNAVDQFASSEAAKQRTGRRTRWTILLIPLVLVLITASTRYVSHPAVLDAFSAGRDPMSWETWASSLSDWRPHKRHASPEPMPQDSGSETVASAPPATSSALIISVAPTPTVGDIGDQALPTIPSTPPVLPTPFPQPLDSTFSRNFSTQQCLDFFTNMTQSTAFRSCRPFSLLSVQSTAFNEAQSNITTLNDLIWGTCNTDTSFDQCNANMAWFADSMQDVCATDIKADNAIVTQTRDGLLAYTLMRYLACMPDQTTNAYCYVEAAHSKSDDLYFYTLPFGIALPNTTAPSCSPCLNSDMSLYSQWQNLSALNAVYDPAARIANDACGTGWAQVMGAVSAAGRAQVPVIGFLVVLCSMSWVLGR